jgi:transposase
MPPTGPQSKTYLFVAVLPYSGLIYCQAFLNMKTPAWLEAHIAAFAYFGGVVQIVVPDNPTTSTHRRTRGDGERVINARYQDMADHYGVAIVPARVKKPRDKAAVENAVNVVNKRVIGYLDAEVFETLDELRGAIAERVYEINYELVRADDTTRIQRWGCIQRSGTDHRSRSVPNGSTSPGWSPRLLRKPRKGASTKPGA